jgi:hypothetical protein
MDLVNARSIIPEWTKNDSNIYFKSIQSKVKQLGLDSLENGFDSLQIRIWYDYSILPQRKLLIIKNLDSKWIGSLYTMLVPIDSINEENTILNKPETIKLDKIDDVKPKNGWADFVNSILDLGIISLPDMEKLPGIKDTWEDGVNYSVEISVKGNYRFYNYHLPEKFQNKYWQARNMIAILDLVDKEFGIKK